MFVESLRAMQAPQAQAASRGKLHKHTWIHGLPLKMRFRRSKLYISALLPIGVGFLVGILAALMGVGGGFIMVPAMIYLLGMPTSVVVGTSLFQIIFVTANVTFLQAYANQTVDVVLALLLLIGAVIGAQIGAKMSAKLHGEQLRILLAVMVLAVCAKLAYDLTTTPGRHLLLRARPMIRAAAVSGNRRSWPDPARQRQRPCPWWPISKHLVADHHRLHRRPGPGVRHD